MYKKIIFIVCLVIVCFSCKKKSNASQTTQVTQVTPSTSQDSCSSTISFQKDIMPIFSYYCTSCHDTKHHIANLDLTTYDSIAKYANSSLSSIVSGSMPPSGKLSDANIQKFSCWIKQGKQNN